MSCNSDCLRPSRTLGVSVIVLLLLGAVAGPGSVVAQDSPEVSFPITVTTDAEGQQELSLGLDPSASAGIDTSLGEQEQPPLPPSDIFDARLVDDDIPPSGFGEGLIDDFREGTVDFSGTKEHEIQIQPGDGATEATISWELPVGVSGTLTDVITEGDLVNVSMSGSGSFTLTDLNITKLFVTLEYSGSVNFSPEAADDSYSTVRDSGLSVTDPANGVLANDTDPDGDSLSASVVSGVSNGTLTLDADGTFEYVPDEGFIGTDSFTYEVSDGESVDQATATIEVEPAENLSPTAEDDNFATTVGQPLTVDAPGVLQNDTDPNGDALSAALISGVSQGTLTLDGDGSFEYTPDPGFTGTDQFTYEARDGNGGTDQATAEITVQSEGEAPEVAFPITVTPNTQEGPNAGEMDELTLGLDPDATPGIDPGLGEVEQPPPPPSGLFDARLIDEDIPPSGFGEGLLTDIRTGGADFTGTKEHEIQVQPGEGTNSVTLSWTLPPGVTGQLQDVTTGGDIVDEPMTGSGSFTYENLSVTKLLVTLNYGAPNTPPEASDDEYTAAAGQILQVDSAEGVLANDVAPDGDELTASVVSGVSNGTLTLNDDGSFTYGPETGFTGTDQFTYEVSDGRGGTDQATATIEVQPQQSPEVAIPFTVEADTSTRELTMGLDPDATPGIDPIFGEEEQPPLPPSEVFDARWIDDDVPASGFGEGLLTDIRPGGAGFTGTKVHEVNVQPGGAADSVTFSWALPQGVDGRLEDVVTEGEQVSVPMDGDGTFTLTNLDISTLTVTLNYGPPQASNDEYTTVEGSTLSVTNPLNGVLANDSDPNGDALSASLVSEPSEGTLSLNPNGTFEYTPDAGFAGTDTFEYEASDGNGGIDEATVSITVAPADNNPPVATADSFGTEEGQELTVEAPGVLENDSDPDGDSLTASVVEMPSSGSLTLEENGAFTYVPSSGFNGTDTFVYEAGDGNGAVDEAEVTITVEPVNDPPVATADEYETLEDRSLSVTQVGNGVLGNDTDLDGDALTATVVDEPTDGALTLNEDGTFTYEPDLNFNGTDAFTYEVADGSGETDQATATITVVSVNDPPVAVADTFSLDASGSDTTLTVSAPGVIENDSDPDGDDLTATLLAGTANGSIDNFEADGAFEYDPNPGFSGSDRFFYQVDDGNDEQDLAQVVIEVDGSTSAVQPTDEFVANPDNFETVEGQLLEVDVPGVLFNDGGDNLTVEEAAESPQNGTLETLGADGSFDYDPDDGFAGEDQFDYVVSNGAGMTDTATVSIDVGFVNDPPVAEADTFETPEDQALVVEAPGVLANDSDPDGDDLTASVLTNPSNGTLEFNSDGSLEYVPEPNFNGTDEFTYQVSDSGGGPSQLAADQATVQITVTPVNDPPVAEADSFEIPEGEVLTVDAPGVLGNDEDIDAGDNITVDGVVDTPENGTLDTLAADGSFTYEPGPNAGSDSFSYRVVDDSNASDTATVAIEIAGVHDPPVAVADTFETSEDDTLAVDAPGVLGNDSDPDGDSLRVSVLTNPSNGTLDTLAADGSLEYVPEANFNGSDSFNYEVSDGKGEADQATVQIEVTPVNDAPTITSLPDTTLSPAETTTGPLPFTIADVDDPVESLTVTATTSDSTVVPPDSIVLAGTGAERTVTVNPANVSGTSTIQVAVEDDDGAVGTTAFAVTKNTIENNPPEVVVEVPDDTLLTPGPPLQLTGLGQTVFDDPDGDDLTFSAESTDESVVQSLGQSPQVVILQAQGTGSADVVVTATDPFEEVARDTFAVTVSQRDPGAEVPAEAASAVVGPAGNANVGFGGIGVGTRFQNVQQGGTVDVNFFTGSSPSQSFVPADSFESVSPYRWEINNQGVVFDSVDVEFSLQDTSVVGIGDASAVTILQDTEGNGDFDTVPTTFVEADSALVGEGLTSFSTFKFASDDADNPLPVELTDFTVRRDGETALVQWQTASETNNAGFEVQHQGPDADEYVEAGFVESKASGGTTTEPNSYRFEVSDLAPGSHQFRLRQVDIDGTGHLSETVSVTVEMEEALRLTPPAPNPVRSKAQLQFGVREAGEATITLYNVLGQRVATLYDGRPTPGEMQRVRLESGQLSQLSSGVYFVRLRANGETRTQRLVRVR